MARRGYRSKYLRSSTFERNEAGNANSDGEKPAGVEIGQRGDGVAAQDWITGRGPSVVRPHSLRAAQVKFGLYR